MPNMRALLVLICAVVAIESAIEHKIDLWEDTEFTGVGITVINKKQGPGSLEFCNNLGQEWWSRVSSVNTYENCYELYDDINCAGTGLMLWPGSPNHNKLTDLSTGGRDWNDRIRSFRLCDLDDSVGEAGGTLGRRSLNPRRPEKAFWEYFFSNFAAGLLGEFVSRSARNWFINWNFIPGIRGSPSRTYQYAMEWVQNTVANSNQYRTRFQELLNRAQLVVDDRARLNRQYAGSSGQTPSTSQAIHEQIERVWRDIVATIQTAVNNADDYEDYL